MISVIYLLIIQGVLGGFDSLFIHEIKERLAHKPGAVVELRLHAARELLYAVVFAGLGWFEWYGGFAYLMAAVLLIEVLITAWDFVEEDLSRRLSPVERVTHLILSIGYGAVLGLLAPILYHGSQQPSALVWVNYGMASWILTFYAVGVLAWAVRNLLASTGLSHQQRGPSGRDSLRPTGSGA